ncbi:MAG: ribosome recycling factor [Lachnospiraceae bacterium]|nr:ribosome recycling factor [Lachnospiraceae bacterium]
MEQTIQNAEEKMGKTLAALENEFSLVRAGRANPRLLDRITVSYYGVQTHIQQVANISVPEARIILIQPWERTLIKEINKAIYASDIGINPQDDGQSIRLVFPELTGERRQELVKDIKKKAENAKVAVRNIRRDAVEGIKKLEKASEITEDDRKDGESRVQKLTDKYVADIDAALERKTKEIMTV